MSRYPRNYTTTTDFNVTDDATVGDDAAITGDLAVTGATTVSSLVASVGYQSTAVARTASADGTGTGAIAANTSFVTVTSANADHIVTLPPPVPGTVVALRNAGTGYELRTTDPATIAINGGAGAGAESAIGANTLVVCRCDTATTWVCTSFATAGTVSATQVAAA
jgi:hypothetical protein